MKGLATKEKKPQRVELKGRPSKEVLTQVKTLVSSGERETLLFSYSPLFQGEIEVRGRRAGPYGQGFLPLKVSSLPLPPESLGLRLKLDPAGLKGELAFQQGGKFLKFQELNRVLERFPLALGVKGIRVVARPQIVNHLTPEGELRFAVTNLEFKAFKTFTGTMDLSLSDQGPKVKRAQACFDFSPTAKGEIELKPDKQGYLTGQVKTEVELGKAKGEGEFVWDQKGFQGQGKVAYEDEKFSGELDLKMATANEAEALLADKVPRWRPLKKPYAFFAQGTLTFHFTDWLTGQAIVVIDPWGHLTVQGEITPEAEIELFPQKEYRKPLPSLEARASYGIPVLGNVFIFIGVGLELWAVLGPARFYHIKVSGKYSTDPQIAKDFRLEGSLNISAAAGLDARVEGGAGLEIADHDLKAGVGLTGRAGIKGYAEATPAVGYRENPETGRGEFFIRGELELGARPFLGLSGDFFIEVDSPWWSPLGDKEWRWPFLDKEWPLPGTLALKAEVDYVFGSRKWPEIQLGQVDFDPDKFASDLVHRRVKSGRGEKEARGRWKEKNKARVESSKGLKAPKQAKSPQKARGSRASKAPRRFRPRRKRLKAPRRLEALRQKSLQKRARRRAEKGKKIPKKARKTAQRLDPRQSQILKEIREVFAREKEPLSIRRMSRLVRSLKRKHKLKSLKVRIKGEKYHILARFSPEQEVAEGKVKKTIALFTSEPKCESPYEIVNHELIFRRFFLPKAKYYSQKDGTYFYRPYFRNKKIDIEVTHPKKRDENEQRKIWKEKLEQEARENIRKILLKQKEPQKLSLEEIMRHNWHVFPSWGRNCQLTSYDVDHIVEIAVGGAGDQLQNMVLFGRRANRSSGGAFAAYFRVMRAQKDLFPEISKVRLKKEAGEEVYLGRGKVSRGPLWTAEEIASGEHIRRCLKALSRKVGESS